jgi:hypothetical protein
VEELLTQHGEYEKCLDYLGDPEVAFERIRQSWQQMKKFEEQIAARREQMKQFQEMAKTNPLYAHLPLLAAPPKFADKNFVGQTRQLIEILVATDHPADAGKIQAQALTVLDDLRLQTAVSDAEKKLGKSSETTKPVLGFGPVMDQVFEPNDVQLATKVTLTKPYPLSYEGAESDRISVQYAVIELAKQAKLGYDWGASQANAGEVCRKYITPEIKGIPLREAFAKILKPEALTYDIRAGKIVLKTNIHFNLAQPNTTSNSQASEAPDLREAKAKLAELEINFDTNSLPVQRQLARIKELERMTREEPDAPADLRVAKAHLAELRVDYAENNVSVVKALARIKELERMTKEEPAAPADLREAKAELADLRVEYAEQNSHVQETLAKIKALEQK